MMSLIIRENFFSDFAEGFNILRELAYQPETNVTFIFVSRRMVTELESSADISTLANILGKPIYVKGYNEEELEEYYSRNELYGVSITDEDKAKVLEITGAQPYWLDILMYHYVENEGRNKDFESLFNENSGVLYNEYERLMSLLDEQHLLNKLYQIVIGPAYDYTKADVQKLYDYGLIGIENKQATLQSKKLLEYMRMKEATFDFYPLWNKTERRMRNLLKYKLKETTTFMEHNSVLRPLYEMERQGVCLTITSPDVGDIKQAITKDTKMIVMTHASNVTGEMFDIQSVGKLCREKGILFVVDTAQSAGVIPISMKEDNIDILCFTGHKGLMGPQGIGGICIRKGVEIRPLKTGGTGILSFSKTQPGVLPQALEAGTLNGIGIVGLGAAIDFINTYGIDKIREQEMNLIEIFYKKFRRSKELKFTMKSN